MKKILLLIVLAASGCNSKLLNKSNDDIRQDKIVIAVWGQSNAAAVNAQATWDIVQQYLLSQYKEVEIINVAVPQTSSGNWNDASGPLYNSLLQVARTKQPDVYLCTQGEADQAIDPEDYYFHMKRVVDGMKAVTPNAKFYFAKCSYLARAPYINNNARVGQDLLVARGLASYGPDVDQYRMIPQYQRDNGLHFTNAGYKQIGEDWAKILLGR